MALNVSLAVRRRLTTLVWLVGLALAVAAIARRPVDQIPALAWAEPRVVTASEDGQLLELSVALHQSVAVGDALAQLDPGPLNARGAVLEAELESLHQKESSAVQGRSRRFELDRESAASELAKLAAAVDEGVARAQALRERLVVDQKLVAEGVAPSERAEDVRRDLAVVEARLSADRDRYRLARLSADRSGVRAKTVEGPNQWSTVMARRRLAELESRLERLVLRSVSAGQVTEIYSAPGGWLKEGSPVMRISPMEAREVRAWLGSSSVPSAAVGTAAEIRRASGERMPGVVTSVGVERLQLPQELWQRGNIPEWGYLARIELTQGALAPGEPVQVGLRPST